MELEEAKNNIIITEEEVDNILNEMINLSELNLKKKDKEMADIRFQKKMLVVNRETLKKALKRKYKPKSVPNIPEMSIRIEQPSQSLYRVKYYGGV